MQIRKTISLSFILLIFLSFTESFSQHDFSETPSNQIETSTQLAEDDENVLHEFRENIKVNFSGGAKPRLFDFIYMPLIIRADKGQQRLSLQRQSCLRPARKLFIDFGTLVI